VDEAGDGMTDEEGAFLACNFWLAHVRHLQGRRREARERLERLLGLCNDVGLLAEEYDVQAGRQCGNFPQALSHVALVNTVLAMGCTEIDPAP
jgi:GH15 family glucan-1,4-alpha-glucosidase